MHGRDAVRQWIVPLMKQYPNDTCPILAMGASTRRRTGRWSTTPETGSGHAKKTSTTPRTSAPCSLTGNQRETRIRTLEGRGRDRSGRADHSGVIGQSVRESSDFSSTWIALIDARGGASITSGSRREAACRCHCSSVTRCSRNAMENSVFAAPTTTVDAAQLSSVNGPRPICSRIVTTGGFVIDRRCQFAPSTTSV